MLRISTLKHHWEFPVRHWAMTPAQLEVFFKRLIALNTPKASRIKIASSWVLKVSCAYIYIHALHYQDDIFQSYSNGIPMQDEPVDWHVNPQPTKNEPIDCLIDIYITNPKTPSWFLGGGTPGLADQLHGSPQQWTRVSSSRVFCWCWEDCCNGKIFWIP